MTELTLFDYGQLDMESRIVVQQEDKEFERNMGDAGNSFIEACKSLTRIHEALKYKRPGFTDYVGSKQGLSLETARKMLNVARMLPDSSNIRIASREALYLLADPSTPEEARTEAFERAESGEEVTRGTAKTIVAQHRPAPQPTPPPTPARPLDSAVPAFTPPVERPQAAAPRPLTITEVEAVVWRGITVNARIPDKATSAQQAAAQLAWLEKATAADFRSLLNPGVELGEQQLFYVQNALRDELRKIAAPVATEYDNDEYYTPGYILEPARKVLGSIDLDPASCTSDGLDECIALGMVTVKQIMSPDDAKNLICGKVGQSGLGDLTCEWCNGSTLVLHDHHFPIPARDGGTDTVAICPNCHAEYHMLLDTPLYLLQPESEWGK